MLLLAMSTVLRQVHCLYAGGTAWRVWLLYHNVWYPLWYSAQTRQAAGKPPPGVAGVPCMPYIHTCIAA